MDVLDSPLSPRLGALLDAVLPGSRVADIGSDHGLLPLRLAAGGRAAYCLATEKSAGLLRGVRRPPEGAVWASLLDYRAGDGLEAIRPEDRIDTIVLAGMGGRTIVRLLDAREAESPSLTRLVLQPRSEPALARRFLSERGWRVVSERLTEHRSRFHLTLAAERGDDADLYTHKTLSREDLWHAGPLLARSRNAEVRRFWRLERDRLASIVARGSSGPGSSRARSGFSRACRLLAAISTPGG